MNDLLTENSLRYNVFIQKWIYLTNSLEISEDKQENNE